MNRLSLFLKAAVIGFICLLLLIPLGMIQGTVAERARYRAEAVSSVSRSYAGPQTLQAPVVVVPYRIERSHTRIDERGLPQTVLQVEKRQWLFFPKKTSVRGRLIPAIKRRGLHQVRVYELAAEIDGHFELGLPASVAEGVIKDVGIPYLSLGIADVRGLIGMPTLSMEGAQKTFMQGASPAGTRSGLHLELATLAPGESRRHEFRMKLALGGTESFGFVPLADDNHVEIDSTWRHPNFGGDFSPRQQLISERGFKATWDITALASGAQAQYQASSAAEAVIANDAAPASAGESAAASSPEQFTVTLIDPVNIYTQADRASKYGFLFVMLTFVGFLMFELIKRLAIHPIQYGLVGLALAIFFLLLLSLSEHIAFWQAYLVASVACIGLLAVYLSSVLRSRARGLGFAGMLTSLYATLYGLLVSEQNALALGSLMLFAILAAIMLVTRKIDWYALSPASPAKLPATDAADAANAP